ncbi:MAG: cytochrome P450, partial [Chloroflexi bacterium]|nr:cytochrome P450 [Chloroflexota bacterium]
MDEPGWLVAASVAVLAGGPLRDEEEAPRAPLEGLLRDALRPNGRDPVAFEHVDDLVEREFHRRQRRLVQPAFRPERVRGYAEVMTTAAQVACARWKDDQELDIHEEMIQLTMEIASITLFGASVTGLTAKVKEAIATLLPMIDRIAQPTGLIRMLLPSPGNLRLYRARRSLNRVIGEIIQKGREREGEVDDVLSMLLNAQDEEGDGTGMTDEQV